MADEGGECTDRGEDGEQGRGHVPFGCSSIIIITISIAHIDDARYMFLWLGGGKLAARYRTVIFLLGMKRRLGEPRPWNGVEVGRVVISCAGLRKNFNCFFGHGAQQLEKIFLKEKKGKRKRHEKTRRKKKD